RVQAIEVVLADPVEPEPSLVVRACPSRNPNDVTVEAALERRHRRLSDNRNAGQGFAGALVAHAADDGPAGEDQVLERVSVDAPGGPDAAHAGERGGHAEVRVLAVGRAEGQIDHASTADAAQAEAPVLARLDRTRQTQRRR